MKLFKRKEKKNEKSVDRRRNKTSKGIKEKKYSASQVGLYFGVTKNSIIGLLYKEKLKDGYVPAPDSKYT